MICEGIDIVKQELYDSTTMWGAGLRWGAGLVQLLTLVNCCSYFEATISNL